MEPHYDYQPTTIILSGEYVLPRHMFHAYKHFFGKRGKEIFILTDIITENGFHKEREMKATDMKYNLNRSVSLNF